MKQAQPVKKEESSEDETEVKKEEGKEIEHVNGGIKDGKGDGEGDNGVKNENSDQDQDNHTKEEKVDCIAVAAEKLKTEEQD